MATPNLQNIFQNSAAAGFNLLAESYRDPVITAYNRREPRARPEEFTRSLRDKYISNYRTAFPFAQDQEESFRGQVDGLNLYTATKRRDIDGGALLNSIRNGTFSTQANIDTGDHQTVAKLTESLVRWFE